MKQVLRLEAGIVLLSVLHAAKKQTRTDQRHQRESNFRDHQQATQTIVRPAERAASAASFQNLVDVRAGSLDGGDDAEDQTGEQGDQQRKSEHAGIEGKINRAVEKKRRAERPQHVASPIGDEKAGQAAEQRKHGAFGQKLPHQPRASCAHGGA